MRSCRSVYVSARGLLVWVAVRCQRWGRRRIGTMGYRGRFAGVAARGLVGCRAVTVQVGRTAVRCQLPCLCSSCSRMRAIRLNRRAVTCQQVPFLSYTDEPVLLLASQPAAVWLPAMQSLQYGVALRPATGPATQYQ